MMRVKKAASFKIQLLLIIMLCLGTALYAQSSGDAATGSKFKQRLEWSADKNALEYKVEVRSGSKIVESITTSDNFVNLNLPAGNYEYRVSVYDFLGRQQDVSAWQKFEISKANEPVFKNVESAAEVDVSAGSKIVLPVEVDNVAAGATVTLVNVKTGEKIKGALSLSSAAAGVVAAGKSETAKASAEFPKISAGEWKLVVENPSGLKSESPAIVVTTVDKKAEEKARILAEQKAAEEAKKEEERLAKEAEKQAREEEKRLAEEKAEEERLAREEEKRQEEEAERLAKEEAEREKQELLAQKEAEKEAEKAEREEEREKKKAERAAKKTLGIEVKLGAATALNLFDSDLLNLKNYDTLTFNFLPEMVTPAPLLTISYVPNLNWVFTPGLEITASGMWYESRSEPYKGQDFEYVQIFYHNNVEASLIGQLRLLPQKIFLDVKAGAGLSEILVKTIYDGDRADSLKAFVYPTINAGLSFEFVPVKNLVFELGADYNKVLSDKINFSYLLPYLEVGVRF